MLQIRDYTKSREVEAEYVKITKKLKICDNDDIMIGRYGASLGKILTGLAGAYNVAIMKTIPDLQALTKPYLKYYLLSHIFQNYLRHIGGRAAQAGFSKDDLVGLEIPLPSLSEQEKIVTYLDTSFAKIDAIKANAEKELEEAKKLFAAALNEAMTPKEGWVEKTLREIGITQTGTTPSKSKKENYGDFMPFIRPSEININGNGALDYDSEIKLSEQGANVGRVFQKGSILMVCIGATISKVGYCVKTVSCNQQINVLTPNEKYDHKFLFYAMSNRPFKEKVIKEGTSSQATLPIINKGKWEQLKLTVPPLADQHSIVTHLDTLSEKVRLLQSNYEKISSECDALKQAILRDTFE